MSRLSKGLSKISSTVLGKFGGDITIKRTTQSAYNVEDGTVVKSQTSVTIKGILQNVNQREVNDLIKETDKICSIAASDLTFVPTTSEEVTIVSINYKIIRIVTTENDNQEIKYKLYLRA
jgi:hypothetical protein|tara:strand:- start:1081 stop:1440 length:360 start_codon:yes stop_codon:yes gene_type:complete